MARNKERNQKMKDERREQILSNALKLFATKGLAATKITDIVSASGISQGLMYHYYRSKDEIFVEIIKSAFEKMNAAALGLEKLPVTPLEKIRLAIEKLLRGLDDNDNAGHYYLLITQASLLESIPDAAKAFIKNNGAVHYEVITRIIIEGQKNGTIKNHDARELALVFWTAINGLAINKAIHGKKFTSPDPAILMSMFETGNK